VILRGDIKYSRIEITRHAYGFLDSGGRRMRVAELLKTECHKYDAFLRQAAAIARTGMRVVIEAAVNKRNLPL
jgi:hypothetical protein